MPPAITTLPAEVTVVGQAACPDGKSDNLGGVKACLPSEANGNVLETLAG